MVADLRAADRPGRHRLLQNHCAGLPGCRIELLPAAFRTVNGYGLTIDNRTGSIRGFGSLPDDIREQATRGRLTSGPGWGTPILPGERWRRLPFTDITGAYERSAAANGTLGLRIGFVPSGQVSGMSLLSPPR